jgi:hypothetical protein
MRTMTADDRVYDRSINQDDELLSLRFGILRLAMCLEMYRRHRHQKTVSLDAFSSDYISTSKYKLERCVRSRYNKTVTLGI